MKEAFGWRKLRSDTIHPTNRATAHSPVGPLSLFGLLLASTLGMASGQTPTPVFTFADTNSLAAWCVTWGNPAPALAWDGTRDSTNNPDSGSLRVTGNFAGVENEFFAVNCLFLNESNQPVEINIYRYVYMKLDLRVDPGSAPNTNGTFGFVEVGTVSSTWGHILVATLPIPLSATNWTHFQPLLPMSLDFGTVVGVYLQVGSWLGGFTNALTLNIDNFGFGGGYCCAPPHLWLERADAGPGYWLKWSTQVPSTRVQACTNLAAGNWCDTGLETNAVPVIGGVGLPVPQPTELPVFWRLWIGTP